jgi:CO/xanthine dehydrogenase Mo-binding subunit
VRKGNIEQGFAEADLVFEDTYRVPRYAHCSIEVHAAVGLCDQAGRITVWTASQSPHTQRHIFAELLGPSRGEPSRCARGHAVCGRRLWR